MKPLHVTIQMKAIEKNFPVVLFFYEVWFLGFNQWMKTSGMTIEVKTIEQYFSFGMFYYTVRF